MMYNDNSIARKSGRGMPPLFTLFFIDSPARPA